MAGEYWQRVIGADLNQFNQYSALVTNPLARRLRHSAYHAMIEDAAREILTPFQANRLTQLVKQAKDKGDVSLGSAEERSLTDPIVKQIIDEGRLVVMPGLAESWPQGWTMGFDALAIDPERQKDAYRFLLKEVRTNLLEMAREMPSSASPSSFQQDEEGSYSRLKQAIIQRCNDISDEFERIGKLGEGQEIVFDHKILRSDITVSTTTATRSKLDGYVADKVFTTLLKVRQELGNNQHWMPYIDTQAGIKCVSIALSQVVDPNAYVNHVGLIQSREGLKDAPRI